MADLLDYLEGNAITADRNAKLAAWGQQAYANDPYLSGLAQSDPGAFRELLPSLVAKQQQMALLGLTGNSQPNSQPSALSQIGSPADSNVGYGAQDQPAPQNLPSAQPQQQQSSALEQIRQAYALGNGDVEKGFNALKAQKALAVPPGIGPIPTGQQLVNGTLQNIPGAMTPGQQDRDKDFADIYTPFKNTGGQANSASQINAIQGVIDDLSTGKLKTGDLPAKFSLDNEGMPTDIGKLADPSLIVANNQVAKAVLPSSKALFGARVTQGEVFRNLMANGLNPYASNEENIKNLTTLKNNLTTAQQNLSKAGEYFDKNGTLAGYQGSVPGVDAGATPLNPSAATNQPNPALLEALKKRGLVK